MTKNIHPYYLEKKLISTKFHLLNIHWQTNESCTVKPLIRAQIKLLTPAQKQLLAGNCCKWQDLHLREEQYRVQDHDSVGGHRQACRSAYSHQGPRVAAKSLPQLHSNCFGKQSKRQVKINIANYDKHKLSSAISTFFLGLYRNSILFGDDVKKAAQQFQRPHQISMMQQSHLHCLQW